jgi:hypothetical protein
MIYGSWTVVSQPTGDKWLCRCQCGTEKLVVARTLKSGTSKSCGCYRDRKSAERGYRHGFSGTPEYNAYSDMIRRCYNSEFKHFNRYGGRGIVVCDRWTNAESGVANFIADMGPRPSPRYTLERKDNDGSYEPSNCTWADRKHQARNRNICRRYEYKGKLATAAEHAEDHGLTKKWLESRLTLGWSIAEAIELPRNTRSARASWKRALLPNCRT